MNINSISGEKRIGPNEEAAVTAMARSMITRNRVGALTLSELQSLSEDYSAGKRPRRIAAKVALTIISGSK